MRSFFIAYLCLSFVGCKNAAKHSTVISDEEVKQSIDSMLENIPDGYWKIVGTEPFWSIYIHKDTIMFTKLNEKVDTTFFKQTQFNAVNSYSNYKLIDAEQNIATLIIKKEQCSDGMSDNIYPYSASFIYKDIELKGCAEMK